MTTKTLNRKTRALEKEMKLLRSFVIGQAGKDSEGAYNPKFVKKILREAAQEKPRYEFRGADRFLDHIRRK